MAQAQDPCTRLTHGLSALQVIHTNLSVRQGLELVVSVGMAIPSALIAAPSTQH